jgi:hypothetical protein
MNRTVTKGLSHLGKCFSLLAILVYWAGCGEGLQEVDRPSYWPVDSAIYEMCSGVEPRRIARDTSSSPQPTERRQSAGAVGQLHPDWALTDKQPESCGFGQQYGLSSFRGRIVVLALLASW